MKRIGFCVALLAAWLIPRPARADCRNASCVALQKMLAERTSEFAPLRGKVLSRRGDKRPDEYAGKLKLPGAQQCTIEVVGQSYLYFCIFPHEPYSSVIDEYNRYAGYVKDAVPANWVTWQASAQGKNGAPGPSRAFRAGPARQQPIIEIVTLMPQKQLPHLLVVVHGAGAGVATAR